MARSGWPTWTICPGSTVFFETMPAAGATTRVFASWSSAAASSACACSTLAPARPAAASLTGTWVCWDWASATRASASSTRRSACWTDSARRRVSTSAAFRVALRLGEPPPGGVQRGDRRAMGGAGRVELLLRR